MKYFNFKDLLCLLIHIRVNHYTWICFSVHTYVSRVDTNIWGVKTANSFVCLCCAQLTTKETERVWVSRYNHKCINITFSVLVIFHSILHVQNLTCLLCCFSSATPLTCFFNIFTFLIFSLVFSHRTACKNFPCLLSNYPPQVLKEARGNANMCHWLEYEFVEIRISAWKYRLDLS